jgi:hypothetical protein
VLLLTSTALLSYILLREFNAPLLDRIQNAVMYTHPVLWGGGIAGGVLHALTGPDHLLSLLPHILGKRWWRGFRIGSIWGIGHGLTTCFLGGCAYLLKEVLVDFKALSVLVNINSLAVGLTLLIIGLLGLHEGEQYHASLKTKVDLTEDSPLADPEAEGGGVPGDDESAPTASSSSSVMGGITDTAFSMLTCGGGRSSGSSRSLSQDVVYLAIFLNGLFLGFSWDGLPSLAPTLATSTVGSLVAFLAGNFFGTVLSIGLCAAVIAEGSSWLSRLSNEALVSYMCVGSSVLATCMGCATISLTVVRDESLGTSARCLAVALLMVVVLAIMARILQSRSLFNVSSKLRLLLVEDSGVAMKLVSDNNDV